MNEAPNSTVPSEPTEFAVLIFTDICDSTALKARHGALAYKAAAELHNRLFERLAAEEKLALIKNTGDGYFARTASVAAAVRFALRFQHGMRVMTWPGITLTTRVGIHAGELASITTLGQADVLAPAADLVARVMLLAVGGQILLTRWPFDEARHFVRTHPPQEGGATPTLQWLAHGPYLFKGCEEPVEVFEVGATELAPLSPPPDGEKARRAIRAGEEETLGWRPAVGLEVPGRAGWMLARKLGEGGFGEVWLAEQAKLKQRRVFKFCFDEDRLRSFKRELTFFRLIRDALGERDDIARLYEVKLDAPPFFLESEFADQGNLVEWCERQGGVATIPLSRRLDLVAHIAEAVAAAHSIGILHKDLKPQNVLMHAGADGVARPQLTDFGIGALVNRDALSGRAITAAGFTVNTLVSSGSGSSMTRLYAPPEQLAGKTYTTQGDVYSLGVLLYQFVIGDFSRAVAPGWEREVDDELLRDDLAECLDGDPERRLPGAAEIALRLRTLEARRAGRAAEHQRIATSARRKRVARLATAGAVVAGVCALALAAGFLRERTLRARSADAERAARQGQAEADQARGQAVNLVEFMTVTMRKRLESVGRIELIEDAVAAAEKYFAARGQNLTSKEQLHRALVYRTRGEVERTKLNLVTAHAAYQSAVELTTRLHAADSTNLAWVEAHAAALWNLAITTWDRGRLADALPIYQQAFEVLPPATELSAAPLTLRILAASIEGSLANALSAADRAEAAKPHADRQWQAVKALHTAYPDSVEVISQYVEALLGTVKASDKDSDKLFAEARTLVDALRKKEPQNYQHLRLEFALEARLGAFLEQTGRYADAIAAYEKAIRLATDYRDWDPLSQWAAWELSEAHNGLAYVLKNQNQHAIAQQHYEKCARLAEEMLAHDPASKRWLGELHGAYFYLAEMAAALGRDTTATDYYLKCIAIVERMGSRDGNTLGRLVPLMIRQKKLDDAVEYGLMAVQDIDLDCAAQPHRMQGYNRLEYAKALRAKENLAEAARVTGEAVEIFRRLAGDAWVHKSHWDLGQGLRAHAGSLIALGRFDEAKAVAEECVKISDRVAQSDPTNEPWAKEQETSHSQLARCEEQLAAPEGAEAALRRVLAVWERAVAASPQSPLLQIQRADARTRLGKFTTERGRRDEGFKEMRRGAEEKETVARAFPHLLRLRSAGSTWRNYAKALGPAKPDAPWLHEQRDALQRAANLVRESARLLRESEKPAVDELRWSLSEAGWVLFDLGSCFAALKDIPECEGAFEEALTFADEYRSRCTAGNAFGATDQVCNILFNSSQRLLDHARLEPVREKVERLAAEVARAEKIPGAKPSDLKRLQDWLVQVRKQLAAKEN